MKRECKTSTFNKLIACEFHATLVQKINIIV